MAGSFTFFSEYMNLFQTKFVHMCVIDTMIIQICNLIHRLLRHTAISYKLFTQNWIKM